MSYNAFMKDEFSVPPEFEERSKALFAKKSIDEREFVDLCLLATKLIDAHWNKRQGMAYRIAGAWLSYENIEQDSLLDQIGGEFGVLELPDYHVAGSEAEVRKEWDKIKELVKQADKKFPKN